MHTHNQVVYTRGRIVISGILKKGARTIYKKKNETREFRGLGPSVGDPVKSRQMPFESHARHTVGGDYNTCCWSSSSAS